MLIIKNIHASSLLLLYDKIINKKVYHSTINCPSLGRSKTIYHGTIAESGKPRGCKNCY
ncbi:MAG: hypothetical protein ACLTHF_16190 [Fusicatenibacter saccharivorans]